MPSGCNLPATITTTHHLFAHKLLQQTRVGSIVARRQWAKTKTRATQNQPRRYILTFIITSSKTHMLRTAFAQGEGFFLFHLQPEPPNRNTPPTGRTHMFSFLLSLYSTERHPSFRYHTMQKTRKKRHSQSKKKKNGTYTQIHFTVNTIELYLVNITLQAKHDDYSSMNIIRAPHTDYLNRSPDRAMTAAFSYPPSLACLLLVVLLLYVLLAPSPSLPRAAAVGGSTHAPDPLPAFPSRAGTPVYSLLPASSSPPRGPRPRRRRYHPRLPTGPGPGCRPRRRCPSDRFGAPVRVILCLLLLRCCCRCHPWCPLSLLLHLRSVLSADLRAWGKP